MTKKKSPKTVANLTEQLRKARSQARNERVKRLALEEGIKLGISLAKEAK